MKMQKLVCLYTILSHDSLNNNFVACKCCNCNALSSIIILGVYFDKIISSYGFSV